MLNSEEECDDYFGTQKFLNESDFSEKELDVKKDNKSFNDSYLVPKEITDNQNIDYPNIANIEAIFNNSEVEQMEEISMSDFMNKKRRKKKKIFYTKKEIDEKYIYKKSKYIFEQQISFIPLNKVCKSLDNCDYSKLYEKTKRKNK